VSNYNDYATKQAPQIAEVVGLMADELVRAGLVELPVVGKHSATGTREAKHQTLIHSNSKSNDWKESAFSPWRSLTIQTAPPTKATRSWYTIAIRIICASARQLILILSRGISHRWRAFRRTIPDGDMPCYLLKCSTAEDKILIE
jgi:hypothetical protein